MESQTTQPIQQLSGRALSTTCLIFITTSLYRYFLAFLLGADFIFDFFTLKFAEYVEKSWAITLRFSLLFVEFAGFLILLRYFIKSWRSEEPKD